jgi:tripartite-type tricarboxylate transporter receptor subunit TctC
VVAEMKNLGAVPMTGTAAEADALIRKEAARWGRAVRDAGVQLD